MEKARLNEPYHHTNTINSSNAIKTLYRNGIIEKKQVTEQDLKWACRV